MMFKPRSGTKGPTGQAGGRALARRMALRDIRANKSTSALVLSLIALPLMLMVLAVTLIDSAVPTGPENASRQLGGFDLQLLGSEYPLGAVQNPNDPFQSASNGDPGPEEETTGAADVPAILKQLDEGASSTVVRNGYLKFPGADGEVQTEVTVGELQDPRFTGRYTLSAGAWGTGESVAINRDLADATGLGIGGRLVLGDAGYPINGIAEQSVGMGLSGSGLGLSLGIGGFESPAVFLAPGHPMAKEAEHAYFSVFVEGMEIDLERQAALNALGIGSYARDFIIDPPASGLWTGSSGDDARAEALFRFMAISTVGFFVFLEVGLLAGAAFAVGAKRQRRTFALLGANGADAGVIRWIGGYSGLFLGGSAVLLGTGLGLAGARGVTWWSEANAGGFPGWHVPWSIIAALVLLGLASAVVAALVPARSVSRNAALSALRAEASPSARPRIPVLGFVFLGLGAACWSVALVLGFGAGSYGVLNERGSLVAGGFIAGMVLCTLGLMLSIGFILRVLGNAGHRLPLAGRLAVRDIQRNHGRTVPAVAAVIAGTALATALALAAGHTVSGAGFAEPTKPPNLQAIFLMSGTEEDLSVNENDARTKAAEVIEQLERSGHAPLSSARQGSFHAGKRQPGTGDSSGGPWVALLAPSSICRYGHQDMDSSTAPDLAGLEARTQAVAQSIWESDRFTARYCGVDGNGSGASVHAENSATITDLAGLKLLLDKSYTPAAGEAFGKGKAIVTVPEFVTDQQRVALGIPDMGLPEVERGYFYASPAGALLGIPVKDAFEIDALEVRVPHRNVPPVMMSKEAMIGTGGFIADSTLLVDLGKSLNTEEIRAVNKDLERLGVSLETRIEPSGMDRLMVLLPWLLGIAAGLLVLGTVAVTTGLALADGRRDARVMAGVGASLETRRRFGAAQAGFTALLGTVLGMLLGAMPVLLLLVVMEGTVDPRLLAPLTVLVAVPPLAGLVGWLMVPRRIRAARMGG
ncbi:FtsX-like permease family protein [Arthrobacter sp. UCD-GKA]|uniref:FtsX-like permease family protein n=1 Tax=Arthrobacter sp. UCD-GKA TaxID=1913576 RepID=UPI000B2EE335|nr:FtsX-like permease family protein [Arthrobacter sp. UCD-GKA]